MKNFDRISIEALNEFKTNFGEIKFKEVEDKVMNSNSIRSVMANLENSRSRISSGLVFNAVATVRFFVFSNKKNYALGCLFFIIWDQVCNIGNSIHSDEEMVNILEECFEKSKNQLW